MSDQARCGDVPQRLRRYQDDFAIGKAVRRIAGYARQPGFPGQECARDLDDGRFLQLGDIGAEIRQLK